LKCPGCGSDNPEGYTFCGRCGATLLRPVDLRDDRLKEAKEYIRKAIANRKITDRIVSWIWLFIAIMIIICSGVASIGLLMVSVLSADYATFNLLVQIIWIAALVVTTAIFSYLAFVLVRRQNEHFTRDRALREGILTLLRTASDPSGRSTLVANELTAMNNANGPREQYHDERIWALLMAAPLVTILIIWGMTYITTSTAYWTIVVMTIPLLVLVVFSEALAMLYMFYFLGKQIFEHDERWFVFEQNTKSIMTKLMWPQITRTKQRRIEKREFAIYLIVSIFISPFIIYWWYTLIKDPNDHFESQWEFEDRLAEIIRK
jgi:hypothetical protein